MASLYEMTEQAKALYELLQTEEIDEQIFSDTVEAIGANEKCESYCHIIKQLQNDESMYEHEIERLKKHKQSASNACTRMKNALIEFMQASGQDKIKAGTFSISTTRSQSVSIIDEKLIPSIYLTPQPPKINKAEIKNALKAGNEVKGAILSNNRGICIR